MIDGFSIPKGTITLGSLLPGPTLLMPCQKATQAPPIGETVTDKWIKLLKN
jgi:hypothetical protein